MSVLRNRKWNPAFPARPAAAFPPLAYRWSRERVALAGCLSYITGYGAMRLGEGCAERDGWCQCCRSGSGIQCLFEPWIRDRFFPDAGSRFQNPYFWELSDNFWVKSSIILWKLAKIFFFSSSKIEYFQFGEICGYKKKGMTTNFFPFSLLLLFLDPGPEIRDPGWVKIRIRIPG